MHTLRRRAIRTARKSCVFGPAGLRVPSVQRRAHRRPAAGVRLALASCQASQVLYGKSGGWFEPAAGRVKKAAFVGAPSVRWLS